MYKDLSYLGRLIKCPYIFAASTRKDFQNQGLFKQVLKKAFKKLYRRGVTVCALYPFEHSFYQKFGFTTVCYVLNRTLNFAGKEPLKKSDFNISCLTKAYNQYFEGFDIYIKRNDKDMQKKVDECIVCGGKLFYSDGSYILYDKDDSEALINSDTFSLNCTSDTNNLTAQVYSQNFDISYTMTRIVNIKKLLKTIPYAFDGTIKLKITDDFFKPNNVTLEIKVLKGKAKLRKSKTFDEEVSISDFTKLVFGTYKSGEFSKELTAIFPNKKTYLIDQI